MNSLVAQSLEKAIARVILILFAFIITGHLLSLRIWLDIVYFLDYFYWGSAVIIGVYVFVMYLFVAFSLQMVEKLRFLLYLRGLSLHGL